MSRTLKTEYAAGMESGLLHDNTDPLYRDNLRKCRIGQTSDSPLVVAYWSGYGAALDSRKIHYVAV